MCNPGLGIEEYFAGAEPWERPIFDIVADHLRSEGDVIIDPIAIGILFKNGPMLCELRAMKRWTALGFYLGRRLTSGRLSRKVVDNGTKYFHVINIDDPDQLDSQVLGWLTEAYHFAGGTLNGGGAGGNGGDPMVPDDVDDPFA